jgi:hypothetical protein
VDIAPREIVQIVQLFLVAPSDKLPKSIVVGLDRRVRQLVPALVEIHLFGCARIECFELV